VLQSISSLGYLNILYSTFCGNSYAGKRQPYPKKIKSRCEQNVTLNGSFYGNGIMMCLLGGSSNKFYPPHPPEILNLVFKVFLAQSTH